MNVLIVYAHPEPSSFNAALKDTAVRALEADGHRVEVSDLNAMAFKAVADAGDFRERSDPERLNYAYEQAAAFETGTTADDIAAEHEKLTRADHLVLQFPLWWYTVPAIMKGWLERVMSLGYAYGAGKMFDRGGLAGTRAMLSCTTHGLEASYGPDGWHGPIEKSLHPVHQGLRFVGFDVLPTFVAYNVIRATDAERQAYLDAFAARVRGMDKETPLPFPPISAYDANGVLIR